MRHAAMSSVSSDRPESALSGVAPVVHPPLRRAQRLRGARAGGTSHGRAGMAARAPGGTCGGAACSRRDTGAGAAYGGDPVVATARAPRLSHRACGPRHAQRSLDGSRKPWHGPRRQPRCRQGPRGHRSRRSARGGNDCQRTATTQWHRLPQRRARIQPRRARTPSQKPRAFPGVRKASLTACAAVRLRARSRFVVQSRHV